MTTQAHLLPFYKRIRQVGLRLNKKLVSSLSTEIMREGGRRLGILRNDTFVFGSEDESSILMDYCIYNCYQDGQNAVQRYLAASPPVDSDEMLLLRAKQNAYYTLMKVIDVEPGVGLTILDTLRGDTGFLMDVGLGTSSRVDDAFAGRLVPIEGFLMTTGAAVPMTRDALLRMRARFERLDPATDCSRMTPEQEAVFAAMTIRSCLEAGALSQVMYAGPGEGPALVSAARGPSQRLRANRNDPCPCGSGRKYKTCCGKR
jgi:hypothetical protein